MITGAESPYMQIVEVATGGGRQGEGGEALDAMTAQDHTAVDAARQLVGLLDPEKDKDRLRIALQRVVAIDPFDCAGAHDTRSHGSCIQPNGRGGARVPRRARRGPDRPRLAHADSPKGCSRPATGDAKREALAALEIAPTYERAQELLLKLVDGPR